ncbi:hypothetical protein [Xanthovirga aplysinae]|uniref:hypothetical protein n=1 Tax=Xanthovirga aplysinae TaxID=2529853 RepID=UPI0012BC203F|nr:hypothetical protein [Xanthovirga aplysinae]MTI31564.1 hypothetical protein [Xanthovirga aplysinae]
MKFHKKRLVFWLYLLTITTLMVGVLEFSLRQFFHLGNPLIYDSSPTYGYRPLPQQSIIKRSGNLINTNNLGIRANKDWNPVEKENKILFLGNSVTFGETVSNHELFSNLALEGIDSLISGSAGVNGWGVKNIHALVKLHDFTPSETYVTVLIENDFYRGLQRASSFHGFWYTKPKSAIHQVGMFFLREYLNNNLSHWNRTSLSPKEEEKKADILVKDAVLALKEIDDFLKSKGYQHQIFISPDSSQVYKGAPYDKRVKSYLEENCIEVTYLLEDVLKFRSNERGVFFYDHVHLNLIGHEVWGKVLNKHIFQEK